MVRFIGEYKAKADDKGRLVFPSAFKSLLPTDEPVQLIVKKDLFAPCLNIFTLEEWDRETAEARSRLNRYNKKESRVLRAYMSGRCIVTPEGKFGRISIPRHMLDSVGIEKEVVFSGCDFKIELWAKDRYEAEAIMDDQEFSDLVEEILG